MRKMLSGLFLLIILNVNAQDCAESLLFKKGTELEYKTYMPKQVGFSASLDFTESTRLLYKIEDVRDSIGNKYSYITKKGTNPEDESRCYFKKYILVCNGKDIVFPFDFYGVDTIFFSNKYPGIYTDKVIYSAEFIDSGVTFSFPLDLEKGKVGYYSGKIRTTLVTRDYPRDRDGSIASLPRESISHPEATITSAEIGEKSKNQSPIGMLDTYKIVFNIDNFYGKTKIPFHYIYDYNSKLGLIKTELISEFMKKRAKAGYMELVRVKK